MSHAIPKRYVALLKDASEMFEETGCVPDADGEPVRAERIVPEAKEYISETIDNRRQSTTPRYGTRLDLRSSSRGLHKNGNGGVKYLHLGEVSTRSRS
jgi:hypothetical protein